MNGYCLFCWIRSRRIKFVFDTAARFNYGDTTAAVGVGLSTRRRGVAIRCDPLQIHPYLKLELWYEGFLRSGVRKGRKGVTRPENWTSMVKRPGRQPNISRGNDDEQARLSTINARDAHYRHMSSLISLISAHDQGRLRDGVGRRPIRRTRCTAVVIRRRS
jgi:hypothetical protein